jgi:hypothetical protein
MAAFDETRTIGASAASQRGDPIRVSRIAALLGALVAIAVQDTAGLSWIFPSASALGPSKLVGSNIANKISSASGSGGRRCEMSPEEFAKFYPPLLDWIQTTLIASAHGAHSHWKRRSVQ